MQELKGIMLATVEAALAELEEEPIAPEGETSLQLLQAIYRDKQQPLNVRVRCAIEALPFEVPSSAPRQLRIWIVRTLPLRLKGLSSARASSPSLACAKVIEHSPATASRGIKGADASL